ncbi:hypothetical protein ACLKA7_004188 [Drosophila subpalustris]
MKSTVVAISLVLWLITVNALPWSPSDPMEPALFQVYRNQKQRNLARIQQLPQNPINFVGPRQATSLEEKDDDDDDDGYYDDDYEDEDKNVAVDYTESDEADYEWR